MRNLKLTIDPETLADIQEATDWYSEQLRGLGTRFQRQVKNQINALKRNASIYSARYEEVRCVLVPKFPYLIHYVIDKQKKTNCCLCCFSYQQKSEDLAEKKGSQKLDLR